MIRYSLFTAIALFVLVGCIEVTNTDSTNNDDERNTNLSVIVSTIAADYSAGSMGVYAIDEDTSFGNLLTIHSDNDIRTYNGSIYIIERGKISNIIKITGSTISKSTVDKQTHFGDTANIYDIAFISDTKAYVTQYDAADIALYNPSTGTIIPEKTIDLSAYNPAGAKTPNMDGALYHNGNVYVGLQKLNDDFSLSDNSSIVVIDASTDEVVKEIILTNKNPQGMVIYGDILYVSCTGAYGVKDGGIEAIDLVSGTSIGLVVEESALNGDVSDVIVIGATKGYAIVAGADYNNSLIEFNPSDKTVGSKVDAVVNASGLAYDGTNVYVGDRDVSNPGLVVINPEDNTQAGPRHDVGLPPNGVAILELDE